MSKKEHVSATPATEWLKNHKVDFEGKIYDYVDHGGTTHCAEVFNVDEHVVIKTLIMQDEMQRPLVVLMHGDCEVSTKNLARQTGRKHIEPCRPNVAEKNSGYQVGGTSPFGTRKNMPVYVEETIVSLPEIFINGGRRGFLVKIKGRVLVDVLGAKTVQCAIKTR